jgi:predicted TIM-barrel fold metal-dependent hydrolase
VLTDVTVIDAHQHFWAMGRDYPWLHQDPDPRRFTGDDRSIRVDYGPLDLRHDFETLRLSGSVHVEAAAGDGLEETRWLSSLHQEFGLPTVLVVGADLAAPGVERRLEELASFPLVRGVRQILAWHPDRRFTYMDRPDLMLDRVWRSGYARLEALGLSFDMQIWPHQLGSAVDLAADFPGTAVVLNHAGMPRNAKGPDFEQWSDGIRRLAELPNSSIKLSGFGMVDHAWTARSIEPFVMHAVEVFGTARTMFASNFPVDKAYSDLPRLYGAYDEITGGASPEERAALFGETARRVYRMVDAPPSPSHTEPLASGSER